MPTQTEALYDDFIADRILFVQQAHKEFIDECVRRARYGSTELSMELARLDGFETALRGMETMLGETSKIVRPSCQYLRQRRDELLDEALRPGWRGRPA